MAFTEKLKARAASAGITVTCVIVIFKIGRDGFWLARPNAGVQVTQASSLPVDRKAWRARTASVDLKMMQRTLLTFLRGKPHVYPIALLPSDADDEERRVQCERADISIAGTLSQILHAVSLGSSASNFPIITVPISIP